MFTFDKQPEILDQSMRSVKRLMSNMGCLISDGCGSGRMGIDGFISTTGIIGCVSDSFAIFSGSGSLRMKYLDARLNHSMKQNLKLELG
ncbi:hypothetical protein [Nitrosomonas sp. Nm166]|uniref:hypothetical protein n=1 Tax=Nitrosomonas sp. Nm166 TaxID=1881054 RepID=UPI001160C6CB|nr:hypothetical protein [Nitrosomonas sp. Nm166]